MALNRVKHYILNSIKQKNYLVVRQGKRDVLPELEQVDGRCADGEEGDVHVGSHLQAEHLGLRVPVHLHRQPTLISPVLV